MSDDGELIPIHNRNYNVEAFRKADDRLLLRGTVHDTKPPGLYIVGDTERLTIHHMIVEMTVSFPQLEILEAGVVFDGFPNETCPGIAPQYDKLVGLSIARGFTHKVRELFGGPRGCTHVTALLQAMAPVAVQCGWSMRVLKMQEAVKSGLPGAAPTVEQQSQMFKQNLNTCHVWDEEGAHVALVRKGGMPRPPLNIRRRLEELGRDEVEWIRLRS
jgi:Protein of unknown function (DUF2889)